MTILSRALLVLGLLGCASVQAQLTALAYDRASSTTFVANADTTSAALADLGSGSTGCCAFGDAVNAFDPFSQIVYAFGPDSADSSAPWLLHAFSASSGAALPDLTLDQPGRIIGAAFEQVPPRLLALRASASGDIDLITVDVATGVLSVLNSGIAGCCSPTPNAVAYQSGVVYLSAQLRGGGTPTLFGFPVDGSPLTSVALTAPLTVLNLDPETGVLYGLQQTLVGPGTGASLSLVQVDAASGVLTPIGSSLTDCCALAPDIGAISNGSLTVVAQTVGASSYSLLSFDLGNGAATFSTSALANERIVNGLFDGLKGLTPTTTTITSITPSPSEIGQVYTVNVSVSASVGIVTVADGIGGTCTITLPASSCPLTGTVIGPLTISATYLGQGSFAGSGDTAMHTVVQATSTTTITSIAPSGSSVVGQAYAVNVNVAGFGTPVGTVAVDDGAGATCTITLPASSCMLTSMSVGPRTITANYSGDVNNTPSTATAPYTITQSASVTSITSIVPTGSTTVGQPYTVNVSVTGFGTPVGTVIVDDGVGATCSITLPAGNCVLTSTVGGAKTITANYSGDTDNLPSSGSAAYQIDPAASTTSIDSVVPNPPSAGTAYSVTVTVAGYGTPSGTVTVDDGNGGNCVTTLPATACNLNSTVAGGLTLTANYSGDASNLPSSATLAISVDPATTVTALTANPDPAVVGMPVQLTATVSQPTAVGVALTGNVDFLDGVTPIAGCSDVPIVAGVAQCSTSFAPTGTRNLQANYLGDANNLASNGALSLLVDRVATTTTLVVSPSSVVSYDTVQLGITVGGGVAPLDGTVSVTSNGVPIAQCQNLTLSGGMTACQFVASQVGTFTLVATYSGDVDDASSSGSAVLRVDALVLPVGGPWVMLVLGFGLLLLGRRSLLRG